MAASRGYSELALLYMLEKGADVNIQHVQGWTALIDATAHGDAKLVNSLLEANVGKELVTENGMKAIDYAEQSFCVLLTLLTYVHVGNMDSKIL
jgi:ankyrin repeat protein